MDEMSAGERELRSAIASYVEEDRWCGTNVLDEDEAQAKRLMDIRFARELINLVMHLVKCRKLVCDLKAESLDELAYGFSGQVDCEELKYSIDSPPHKQ